MWKACDKGYKQLENSVQVQTKRLRVQGKIPHFIFLQMIQFPSQYSPISTYFDAAALRDNIPQEYQLPLETQVKHLLKCEFHSADYHTLSNIVIGLQTAVGLLVKEVYLL